MRFSTLRRFAPITLLATAVLAVPTAASAVPPVVGSTPGDWPPGVVVPEGQGCPDFDLGIEAVNSQGKVRTFVDTNGNPVRTLQTGKGYDLTFINMESGERITFQSKGFVRTTVDNADGETQTITDRGTFAIILFPTDNPQGPKATLYQGRAVYTVTGEFHDVFLSLESSGTTTDICAALR